MTLACLVSQFCTELGPAQPKLVLVFYPFHVDCVAKQDRLAMARTVGGYRCMVMVKLLTP